MHSHLAIIGTNGELALKPDTSLNVTDKNPMFNDVEMFTQTIPLPFDLNRHVLKNMDDMNSTMRSADVQGERFQFVLDGIPFRNTAIKIQEGTKLDGTIDVNFDATNRTFKDMIANMRCRDVTVDDDILIGEKIGDVEVTMNYQEIYDIYISGSWKQGGPNPLLGYRVKMNPVSMQEVFQPFALGFSYPGECYEDSNHVAEPDPDSMKAVRTYPNPNSKDNGGGKNITVKSPHIKTSYINTSQPYPAAKYCNSRIAYTHYKAGVDSEGAYTGETEDEIVPASDRNMDIQEDKSPYWVLDANRPASGLCFYVGYFLERLFKNLGVAYDMTALTNIEDFNYLAFFSTQCHYDAKPKAGVVFSTEEQINNWLESRGCGGKINVNDNLPEIEWFNQVFLKRGDYTSWQIIGDHLASWEHPELESADGIHLEVTGHIQGTDGEFITGNGRRFEASHSMTAKVMQMFANSDNFPDVNVSEVIESLENSFGVRFVYDAEINKVTVKLLRDMFRDQQAPIPFKGTVLKMVKITESIRGIRMKYSAESDAQEQRDNIRYGKRDYDTVYDYCDYPQGYTKFASYDEVTQNIDVGNRTGYCDMQTGNFYRIKVSSDASTTAELRPAVFEVGTMHGVELGDCSKEAEDEDGIKEFVSQFEPIQVNDVAYRGKNYGAQEDPLLVPFIDEDMEHEFLIKKMLNPVSTKWGSIDIVYELCLAECYDPTKTDDGQSPLQHHNWGLTIGFLRPGSGSEDVVNYERDYDGFDNSKWYITSKNYTMNADTYDEHGNFIGNNPQTSFSLKPRAWKPFLYCIYPDGIIGITTDLSLLGTSAMKYRWVPWLIPCNDDQRDQQGNITGRIRSRGMCDTWMIEFFRFLLERQKYYVEALCTAAELADIPNKWLRRWEIDGKVGWINIMTYPVNTETGLGKVEIEFYAL